MSDTQNATMSQHEVRLADYRPPAFLVDTVHLDIRLAGAESKVTAKLALRRNPDAERQADLILDGDELRFVAARLDGKALDESAFEVTPSRLRLADAPEQPFELEIETALDPLSNTKLMGLYRSGSCYCTQCEPEGFRRITYFPDRPDVLAVYTTRIEADRGEAPVLLSNGNHVGGGELPDNRHFAVWHDPFPKPSYLFALVAGDLGHIDDRFTTMSGRTVALKIYVEHGRENDARYAMDALKRAMRWDEETFGREYDLDIFMIVAVSDFNAGAMENKGLNIFNDKYVLASPETATDADYANIEAVIGHEYFHNWTGDRITCRDWFQLCLKEGLTVFRDQEFSADQRSRPVKRISDVRFLRSQQFVEDAGPLAHPVRPEVYHEINNFYTATVYEKGAEVVRMLRTLLGAEAFRAGLDLYFERHDGEAVTVEDFVACFADASGRDLAGFMTWYRQAGTPVVQVDGRYDAGEQRYRLDLRQSVPPTPGQPTKEPVPIPLRLGFVGAEGELDATLNGRRFDGLVTLSTAAASFEFTGLAEPPALSINRDFSAPVTIAMAQSGEDQLRLIRNDSDDLNRWQALQSALITRLVDAALSGRDAAPEQPLTEALREIIREASSSPAFTALMLTLPSDADIAREIGRNVDPDAIHGAGVALRRHIARMLGDDLLACYAAMRPEGPFTPDADGAGRRALRHVALNLACAMPGEAHALARRQFDEADNMTDRSAALGILVANGIEGADVALEAFYQRFRDNSLVVDKWLRVQAEAPFETTLDKVEALTRHPAFNIENPNRVYALLGTFANANFTGFNRADGAGYRFIADKVLELDRRNPQVAARLLGAFRSWQSLEPGRRVKAREMLGVIAATPSLSRDVRDIVNRSLVEQEQA